MPNRCGEGLVARTELITTIDPPESPKCLMAVADGEEHRTGIGLHRLLPCFQCQLMRRSVAKWAPAASSHSNKPVDATQEGDGRLEGPIGFRFDPEVCRPETGTRSPCLQLSDERATVFIVDGDDEDLPALSCQLVGRGGGNSGGSGDDDRFVGETHGVRSSTIVYRRRKVVTDPLKSR